MNLNPTNTKELTELLKSFQTEENAYTPEKYRYVIYARKSTDEKDKQVRSLPDQVRECTELAERLNLKVVDIIQEAESAKEPDIRQKFRAMLEALKAGKYDGVIAWHPDRLARNSKDAGEFIDLVDKHIVKDLKFVSFTFTNDTSGKMLLGITFVLAKEYSDKLSVDVHRGNKSGTDAGKYLNKLKHGYRKDDHQYLRPDGNNFALIKNTFVMRLEGKTLDAIADYLNTNGYTSWRWKKSKPYKMTKQRVRVYMSDPVYTGVLVYGKKLVVNLIEQYDFMSMVSVADFMKINKLDDKSELIKLAKKHRRIDDVQANLMRGMILCSECGETMSAGITRKKNKAKTKQTNYFYYRCETDGCLRYGKSVRAKHIINYFYAYLKKKPFSSRYSYDHYVVEMKRVSQQRIGEARSTMLVLQGQLLKVNERLESTKELLRGGENDSIKEFYRNDLVKIKENIEDIEKHIKEKQGYIDNSKVSIATYGKFLELMENMTTSLTSIKGMAQLDFNIKKMFLNFTVKGNEVVKSTLNSPFDMIERHKVSSSAREKTRTSMP